MKHYGDITKIDGHTVPLVDIICGGSPCQDLSVAGKREGLSGQRSGLFMEQIRIIKEMRDESIRQLSMRGADVDVRHIRPRFMVWENVPGAFSSNKGEDFRCVLEETARIIYKDAVIPMPDKWTPSGCIVGERWSIAWRVHDAQFWGVPQRRKRIALVADFGSRGGAAEILFERESVSGDITESGEKRKGIAGDIEASPDTAISFQERAGRPGGGKGILIQKDHVGALSTLNNQKVCHTIDEKMGNTYIHEDCANTMGARDYKQPQAVCYTLEGNGSRDSHKGDSYKESDTMYTLNTVEQHAICVSQDAYDKFSENDKSASLKACGGTYGGGSEALVIQ